MRCTTADIETPISREQRWRLYVPEATFYTDVQRHIGSITGFFRFALMGLCWCVRARRKMKQLV